MALSSGSKLGPYEILGQLGAGGMGEVYRAKDTRLDRIVAIKILPEKFSRNSDFKQRFEREAHAISNLSHPNICALYDVGHQDGIEYLVMEFLEGQSLADRLSKGPLPPEQVLRYGMEIASALDRAHRQGIIHRDLKPGNIMLTKSGAKLLDFGLAKSFQTVDSSAAVSALATEAKNLTAEGTIVGTFQYMAPEQLEGKDADHRTDIFAFGTTLYEMVTGKKAFTGTSQASLIAAILKEDPKPIYQLQPLTPPIFERLVKTCLEKDPEDRWQSIHDIRSELKWIKDASADEIRASMDARTRTVPKRSVRIAWAAAAASLLFSAFVFLYPNFQDKAKPGVFSLSILAPPGTTLKGAVAGAAVSPDGSKVAIVALDSNKKNHLWLRPFDSQVPHLLNHTENADLPFWSPDGRSLGFFADEKLKKISVSDESVQTICDAPDGRGGSWSETGIILFSPNVDGPLFKVSEEGGVPTQVTSLDPGEKELAHRFPQFLPDNIHFLFSSMPGRSGWFETKIGSLNSKDVQTVLRGAERATYVEPGYLLYQNTENLLLAEEFDAKRLVKKGEPHPICSKNIPDYRLDPFAHFAEPTLSASKNGILVFWQGDSFQDSQLIWLDRNGHLNSTISMPKGRWTELAISPDGKRVVLVKSGQGSSDLWSMELSRGIATRTTMHSDSTSDFSPGWSPDGNRIAFVSDRTGSFALFRRPAITEGNDEELVTPNALFSGFPSWSPDGKNLLYFSYNSKSARDLWVTPTDGHGKPRPYLSSSYNEFRGVFSADGRWVAYSSDESGSIELYAQSFPNPGKKTRISSSGIEDVHVRPFWCGSGNEIIYLGNDGSMTSVPVMEGETLNIGTPQILFHMPENYLSADVSPDCQRFLISVQEGEKSPATITVLQNWTSDLKK